MGKIYACQINFIAIYFEQEMPYLFNIQLLLFVTENGICVSSTEGTNDKVTAEQSDKGMPSYVPVVIAVVVVVILIAIITAVVVYLRKTRHVSIHRRMRCVV